MKEVNKPVPMELNKKGLKEVNDLVDKPVSKDAPKDMPEVPKKVPSFDTTHLEPKTGDFPTPRSPIGRSKSAWGQKLAVKWEPALRSKSLPVISARRADINLDDETLAEVARLQKELVETSKKSKVLNLNDFFWKKNFAFGTQELSGVPGQARNTTGVLPEHVQVSCLKGCKGTSDHGPNQDNFSYCEYKGFEILTVLDGHGGGGHFVSYRAIQSLIFFLCTSPHFPLNMHSAISDAYLKCQEDLSRNSVDSGFDIQISGAACVLLVRKNNKVWISHAGDSRIVIGNSESKDVLFETNDHKPTNAEEKKRLETSGAEVQTFQFEQGSVEISRVFVKGTDYPGLCMSRSLGDVCVKSCGVVAEPEISEFTVKNGDYIVLGTDGVWEFIPSKLVTSSFAKKLNVEGTQKCLSRIVTEAKKRWKTNEGNYCDDITAMIIRF